MARVVVVDPDPRIRGALARLLGDAGHLASELPDVESVGELATSAALVFAAAGPGGSLIDPTAAQLYLLNPNARIVWTGPLAATIQPAVDAGVGVDVLELPTRLPALRSLLARHLKRYAGDVWNGEVFLRRVEGLDERFPPIRVLFLAHRLNASGTLTYGDVEVDLQHGKIADVRGLPTVGMGQGLMQAIGEAIGQGQPPDAAMRAAGVDAIAALLKLSNASEGDRPVRFTSCPIRAQVVLPTRLPRLLGLALEQTVSPAEVRRELGGRSARLVSLHPPEDSPESTWGLSPVGLRVVRAGRSALNLGDVLAAGGGSERHAVWMAVEFLRQLGILRFDDERPSQGLTSGEAAILIDDIVIEAVEVPAEPEPDPREAELKEALERISSLQPWDLFSLEEPTDVHLDVITQRFRDASSEHHPDRFVTAPPAVRELAASCFAAWGNARDLFEEEAFRDEVRARLIARRDGLVFTSETDRKKAKVAHSLGQYHARRECWEEATAAYEEAVQLDPGAWESNFQLLLTRWRAGVLTPAAAAEAMAALTPTTMQGRAELRFQVGEALLAAGEEAAAYSAFQEAVNAVPGHVGAARRLRLRSMRQDKAAAERKAGLRGIFKWGRKDEG